MTSEKAANWREFHRFWFGDGTLDDAAYAGARVDVWFKTDPAFDDALRRRFGATLARARTGGCDDWADSLRGALSLVILFDQVPRNVNRGNAAAFACDERALQLARATLARDDVAELSLIEHVFLYMPFEHAEDLAAQDVCVAGYRALRDRAPAAMHDLLSQCVSAGEEHRDVIRRFGRFPHRNAVLGRTSSAEEIAFSENHHGWGQGTAARKR